MQNLAADEETTWELEVDIGVDLAAGFKARLSGFQSQRTGQGIAANGSNVR